MTLLEFYSIIKRNILLILLISVSTASIGYYMTSNKNDNLSIIIKCFPAQEFKSEILFFAPNIRDYFQVNSLKNSRNENVEKFSNKYNIKSVSYQKPSIDTLNVWFRLNLEEPNSNYDELTEDFISLINNILNKQTPLEIQPKNMRIEFLKPLFNDIPYTVVSRKRINPFKASFIIFITSFIFLGLFFAFLRDLKKMNSNKN